MKSIVTGKITLSTGTDIIFRDCYGLIRTEDQKKNFILRTLGDREVFSIQKNDKGYQLNPDPGGNLPVYAYTNSGVLYFANTFLELLELIPQSSYPEINYDSLIRMLMMEPDQRGHTILNGVIVANGNTQLQWDGEVLKRTTSLDPEYYSETSSGFDELLANKLAWVKKLNDSEVGVTLSGGLDSAVIWEALHRLGVKPTALTIIYPGAAGIRQSQKIQEIIDKYQSNWLTVSAENFTLNHHLVDPYRSIYGDLYDMLGEKARQSGIKIVLGGAGGDELAANPGFNNALIDIKKRIPSYITQAAVDKWNLLTVPVDTTSSLIPSSVLNIRGITGDIGFSQGVWAESTFCIPDFWHWSKTIPKEWGINKHGFRDYLANSGINKIASSVENEDYSDVYMHGISEFIRSNNFIKLINDSILVNLGWVEKEDLIQIRNESKLEYNCRLQYLGIVYVLEKFLQSYISKKGGII